MPSSEADEVENRLITANYISSVTFGDSFFLRKQEPFCRFVTFPLTGELPQWEAIDTPQFKNQIQNQKLPTPRCREFC